MAISANATSDQKRSPLARDPPETYALCSRVQRIQRAYRLESNPRVRAEHLLPVHANLRDDRRPWA